MSDDWSDIKQDLLNANLGTELGAQALFSHVVAASGVPQGKLETATSYAHADVAREIAAFGRLAEDEHHESS